MDPQKSSAPGVTPEGQSDHNEVSVNLNGDQPQGGLSAPAQDAAVSSPAQSDQAPADFSSPAAPIADPGTAFSPTPVSDMQSGTQAEPTDPAQVQNDLAQVATAQAGVEAPQDSPEAVPAPSQGVMPEQDVAQQSNPGVTPALGVDPTVPPAAAEPSTAPTEAPAAPHDKKIIVILGVVAVVLLAAIATLFLI